MNLGAQLHVPRDVRNPSEEALDDGITFHILGLDGTCEADVIQGSAPTQGHIDLAR